MREGSVPSNSNPYDRRHNTRDGDALARPTRFADDGELVAANAAPAYSPQTGRTIHDPARDRLEMADEVDHAGLTLADVEFLVKRKIAKARRDGDDAAYMRHMQDVAEVRRQAWDEGREQGEEDGRFALLEAIDHEVGGEVRDLHRLAVAIVDARERKTKADREQTSVAALLQFAEAVATVTDTLIYKHHNGFVGEMPF
jgi:hypothetical protein